MTRRISDWRELPFEEIWCVDTEFYPGLGFDHGGRAGDLPTPLCLVACEMRSGRTIELWQDELGVNPPYRLDSKTLITGYMLAAEFGFHIRRGWGQPACAIDPYIEFRMLTNDARIRSGDREKGFYSLGGALRFFGEDGIDGAHKKDMRERILRGPPFSVQERADIFAYCRNDVDALVRLVPHIVPTIRSLPHSMMRAQFQWAIAQQERRGVPIDLPMLEHIRTRWDDMRVDIVTEMDNAYGCYEVTGGVAHWRKDRFKAYVRRNRLPWPTYPSGELDESTDTFKDMARAFPQIEPLRELRSSLSKLRLSSLEVGSDGRNRTSLWAYSSKTGRNQPSTSGYVFGPAKWIRFLITPPAGYGLVHRDYRQQEMHIAGVVSNDPELLAACQAPSVYIGIAQQLGLAPPGATKATDPAIHALFKSVTLGINYGLMARSLAARTGLSLFEAVEILARLRARFRVLEAFSRSVLDHAGLDLELTTQFGWRMRCLPGSNPRTLKNYPIQSSAAEILHVACILAERRGLEIVAPVHDAFMAQAPIGELEDASIELDRVMRDASKIVLRGYEIPTDVQLVRPGEQFFDERGLQMWKTVTGLLAKLEERAA
jgi:DNA polymerase-1